jgi:hypothetical protein
MSDTKQDMTKQSGAVTPQEHHSAIILKNSFTLRNTLKNIVEYKLYR